MTEQERGRRMAERYAAMSDAEFAETIRQYESHQCEAEHDRFTPDDIWASLARIGASLRFERSRRDSARAA